MTFWRAWSAASSMPTLFRYLRREIHATVLMVLVAFLCVFAFFDLVAELDDVGRGGYQIQHAFVYILLTLPGRLYELLPLAALIGGLYALTQLAKHSEITVMRASGLSTAHFLRLLTRIALPIMLLTFLVGEFVTPFSERLAKQWRLEHTQESVAQQLRSGVWVRDGRRFVNIREVMPDGSLRQVRVYEFDEQMRLLSLAEAARGEHQGESWLLDDIAVTRFEGARTVVEQTSQMNWHTEVTPQMLAVLMVSPERMTVLTLHAYIRHLQDNAQKTERFEIALWKKLAYPFAVLVMLVLALPFAYLHDRMGGMSWKVFAGIMIGVAFHLINGLFTNLGAINSWPPMLSAWTPSLLFLCAAAGFLWWVERR